MSTLPMPAEQLFLTETPELSSIQTQESPWAKNMILALCLILLGIVIHELVKRVPETEAN